MEMSKPGLCCESCFEIIAKYNTHTAALWLDLCELQLHSPVFGLWTEECEELRLLEILGFIVTTETPNIIIVKVKGERCDNQGPYFCGGNCEA